MNPLMVVDLSLNVAGCYTRSFPQRSSDQYCGPNMLAGEFHRLPSTSDMLASLGSLRFENIRHLTQPPDVQGTERSKAPEFNAFCLVGSLNKGVRVASGPP